ncbi:MAG TPA: hypothetical protein VKB39_02545 [Candidatus Baltobacteraceae bacterium]|nr:hypothetical protein [Candidatus Baltobacteraceae bacterium]
MEPPRSRPDWTWSLIALCAVALIFVAGEIANTFNGHSRYWDFGRYSNGEPFVLVAGEPRSGGAAAEAGIRRDDRFDLREQTFATRWAENAGPSSEPLTLIVRRGERVISIRFLGSTVWDGAIIPKMLYRLVPAIAGLWFLGCALLITTRRASQAEGRWLALTLLCMVPSGVQFLRVVPIADSLLSVAFINSLLPLALLVGLSSQFGVRGIWRSCTQWVAYAAIAVSATVAFLAYYGYMTLRLDPLPLSRGSPSIVLNGATIFIALLAVIWAVTSTPKEARARAGWLLLPLTVSISLAVPIGLLQNYTQSWILYTSTYILSGASMLLGALLVTYALLQRRVVDVGFVVSRTIVVAILSLIVVVAFVLLEWALGTVLADASHATGLFANATLALVLGLSMRYIHSRVDSFVDAVMFRKRHEDERALRAFAKEATFITDSDALFDLSIAKVRAHTNATGAALFVNGDGLYRSVRGFGTVPSEAGENDPAILALKAWHEPLDPHRYETALAGDLALPIVARGHLHGILLFEQRESGEAYAPDEIDALAQFAHGIGSAYDALAGRITESNATVAAISELLDRRFGPLE